MIPFTTLTTISTSLLIFLFTIPSLSQQKVTVSLTPTTIPKSGDLITIQWNGIGSPSELDWVGIYSPPDSAHNNFIGYLFLSSSSGWKSGSGSITIPLVNLRSGYQFRIFHWERSEIDPTRKDHEGNPIPGTNHLLAESDVIGFEPGQGPEQVHLALTGRDGEMRVMFVTHDGKESFVRYGLTREDLDRVVGTRVATYKREDMCDAPANESIGWRDPGYINDGVMVKLKKGERYYYKVGSDVAGWCQTFSFVSHNEDSNEAIAFLFGDMGTATPYRTFLRTQDESISTINWISRDLEALGDKPTLISHIGDISYARGYSWLWDNFFSQIEPIASKVPYHVCIGNHEYNWPLQPWRPDWASTIYGKDSGGECGVPYSIRFNMPGNSSEPTGAHAPATRNLYYSFDMGSVHFVYMSSETNFLPGSKQYDFLKHDLESVDRAKTPFVVFQGHRPMYTTSSGDRDNPLMERMLEHLEPLLVKNKVSLALWAHVHRYERFCPLSNFTCQSSGLNDKTREVLPVHIVIGMGGQDWQPIWQPTKDHPDAPIYPQPAHSLFRGGEFGYTRLAATKEKLTLSYVGNHDGEVHDKVEIMASGQVVNGGNGSGDAWHERNIEYWLPFYVSSAAVLFLGGFIGYFLGIRSHAGRVASPRRRWIRMRSEEN